VPGLLVALLAAACSGGGLETPSETLQREEQPESTFGYLLDAAPEGYTLCAISTPSALSISSEPGASLHVYGDGSLDDPYEGVLIGVAMFEAAALVDLALGDAVAVELAGGPPPRGVSPGRLVADHPAESGRVLTYQTGAETIQVVVRGDEDIDLLALAESVRTDPSGAEIDAAGLPEGFVDLGDLYELDGRAQFRFAIDYQNRSSSGEIVDQVTLLGAAGDLVSMEAFRFRAAVSEVVDVSRARGVAATIGPGGPSVVSWLAADELILRIFSFQIPPDELVELARSVRFVDGDEWDRLRDEFDPALCDF
jgi:hypothetical protein